VSVEPRTVQALVTPLSGDLGVPDWLRVLSERPGLVALDSAAGSPRDFSLVAFDPLSTPPPQDLDDLKRQVHSLRPMADVPGPFRGGFIGALTYDLGVFGERLELPRDPWETAPIVGGLYTDFIVFDHLQQESWLVLGDVEGEERPDRLQRRSNVEAWMAEVPGVGPACGVGELVRHCPPEEHRRRIEAARSLIAEGEFYQANLAHRFTRRTRGEPVDLYLALRAVNPAPYMGYLAWNAPDGSRHAVLSASPELLLEVSGQEVRTRPIKGTVGRGPDDERDRELARSLLASPKDRAELAMIVDLERNDLSRVCLPGSVRVPEFPMLESYPAVHHLVADVCGTLRPGLDGLDALAALFPGGSITGAPKLRSMEAIADLEGEGRGVFCGSLGFLDARGHARFNILIRTLRWRAKEASNSDGEVSFHVGGGITWSSEAGREEQETLEKGAALVAALGQADEAFGVHLRPGPVSTPTR
jgi:para-aminobenzoate synthetase component 1